MKPTRAPFYPQVHPTSRLLVLPLLLIPLLAPGLSTAQEPAWNPIMGAPTLSFYDLCVLPDGQHGWAVGGISYGGERLSGVLRTTDGGAHWDPLPFAQETGVLLNGVSFVSAGRGWVVGADGVILSTTDGGATWTQQNSGTTRKLSKVHFVDAQRGWITGGWQDGSSYLVLRTTNGGVTWENRSFGSTAYSCEDIFFFDALNGWIVGQDNQIHPHIHHTTDGGLSWTRQQTPATTGSPGSVDFVSANEGWVSTSSLYEVPPGAVLHTTDAGTTWTVQFYTNLPYNYCLDARDRQNVAVASVQILTPVSEQVFVTHDGGQNWGDSTPPVVAYTHAIQYVGTDVWFSCDYGQVLRSRDEGVTWDWDYRAPFWKSIAWSDDQTGWIVAGSSVGTDGYCYRTTDGGSTWGRDRKAPGGSQVTFADAATGWMLWEGSAASVWRTTDSGASWSRHWIGGAWIDGIVFASAMRGWAHGANGTMRATTDGGLTWSSQSLGTTRYVDAAFFLNENEGWCGGGYAGANGFVRHTTNGGTTWMTQNPATSDHITSIFFLDPLTGWALCYGGRVQRTTNGGANWTVAGQVAPYYTYKILMADALNGWLAAGNTFGGQIGEDGRGFIYHTTNGGTTWVEDWVSEDIMGHIYDMGLYYGPDDSPTAVGHHMALLRRYDPAAVDEEGRVGEDTHLSWSIAPNPMQPGSGARIEVVFPSGGPISLVLYDVAGREVETLLGGNRGPGAHLFTWNGTGRDGRPLRDGVYFGRLTVGVQEETRRIVIRR